MDSSYGKELQLAFAALEKATFLSKSILFSNRSIEKADHTPVTLADFAIQGLLVSTLKNAFPDDAFVGEEDASDLRADTSLLNRVWDLLCTIQMEEDGVKIPASKAALCDLIDQCGSTSPQPSGRTWVFDPIDGTKTYMMGQVYAINVALLVDGQQTLSAVACPKTAMHATAPMGNEDVDDTGSILYAVKGHGAFVRLPDGSEERQLRLSAPDAENTDIRFITSVKMADSALEGAHEAIAQHLGAEYPGCDLLPWVLRWAMLAMGIGNAIVWVYKRLDRYAKVWDHAGAMLLFEEAGGKVTDIRGNEIDFLAGRKMIKNYGFVAAPGHLHGRVLEAVHTVLRNQGRDDLL